ncbi:MAG: class I SAM-dependent methyltransferase, partial [Actinomycetia bacterium]|nr:class I SAM-dependent methyltransferase [Actinomycetes bacterium]
ALAEEGRWPVEGGEKRWRLGELTVPWPAIAPLP